MSPLRGRTGVRLWVLLALVCLLASGACADAAEPAAPVTVRVALFNIWELSTDKIATVDEEGVGVHPQLSAAAAIIKRIRPDVLVINEIDHDYGAVGEGHNGPGGGGGRRGQSAPGDRAGGDGSTGYALNARRFADGYLATGDSPIHYPHAWAAPNNTGILSGVDLDGDGSVATAGDRGTRAHGNDSFGYGEYPGQFSMAVLSRYPIDEAAVRTFRELLWTEMPGNHIPEGFYGDEALEVLRLSSKSHQDVPVIVDGRRLRLLISHPTPPVFDGPEDHNGRRNFDEIKLWADYLDGDSWIVDDQGRAGGYAGDAPFLIVGDMNSHPEATESIYDGVAAIRQLLDHPRVRDPDDLLVSAGAPAEVPTATTSFRGRGARIDYVLPSRDLEVLDGGVFWPSEEEDPAGHALAEKASDHRMVWLDVRLPEE